jgi:PhnB protein
MQVKDLNPYLNFKGDCEAAFKFYAELLGGKIEMMMTFAESPMADQVPPEWRKKVLHTRLVIGDKVLMGADASPDRYEPAKGFSVSLGVDKPADAERIFKALASNGTVQMPLAKTFFAEAFGAVVDRFGIPWMVISEAAA